VQQSVERVSDLTVKRIRSAVCARVGTALPQPRVILECTVLFFLVSGLWGLVLFVALQMAL
jgi:hypothetical protein